MPKRKPRSIRARVREAVRLKLLTPEKLADWTYHTEACYLAMTAQARMECLRLHIPLQDVHDIVAEAWLTMLQANIDFTAPGSDREGFARRCVTFRATDWSRRNIKEHKKRAALLLLKNPQSARLESAV